MTTTKTIDGPQTEKINAAEYFRLALSNRHLERRDDAASGVLGLYDPQTGLRFVVDREHVLTATLGEKQKQ